MVSRHTVMARLRPAARRGRTLSNLVEKALWLIRTRRGRGRLTPLPALKGVGDRVDLADRTALHYPMEGR